MLDAKTMEALRVVVDRLKIERSAIDEAVASVEDLITLYSPPVSASTTVDELRERNQSEHGLPKERPGERRCGNCGSVGHRRDKCPKSPLRIEEGVARPPREDDAPPPTPEPPPGENRVCSVHDTTRVKDTGRKRGPYTVYMCGMGHETENTILRRRASA